MKHRWVYVLAVCALALAVGVGVMLSIDGETSRLQRQGAEWEATSRAMSDQLAAMRERTAYMKTLSFNELCAFLAEERAARAVAAEVVKALDSQGRR